MSQETTESKTVLDRTVTQPISLVKTVVFHTGFILAVLLIASPLILAAIMSTQTVQQVFDATFVSIGDKGIDNYIAAITEHNIAGFMFNSIIMAVILVVGKIVVSLLAALALVYYQFRFKNLLFFFILITLMFPVPVRIVPLFELMVDLNWTNTMAALTLPYLASATSVFLLRQQFRSIPASMAESAKLDGVGPIKFLLRVLVPMSKGMIAGLAVIHFVAAWNQYLWPLLVINNESQQVVQVGIKFLQSVRLSGQTDWGLIMAATILTLLIPLLVLLIARKPLLETFGVQPK